MQVATLPAQNNINVLQHLKEGFKQTLKWDKYILGIPNQTTNDNLNCLIDPTLNRVNRLSVLSFENYVYVISHEECCILTVEIKNYDALIDGKRFFYIPIKNKEEAFERIIEIGRYNNHTTGNLLD